MSIKINVGVSKKIGLPDYGSAGSLCNIEIDADNVVLNDPEQFLNRVRDAFEVARIACEEELSHHRVSKGTAQSHREPERKEYRNENPSYGNSSDGNSSSGNYIASAKQLSFINSLTKGIRGMDQRKLERYSDKKFGKGVHQLSPKEASILINDLKTAKDGGMEGLSV